VRSPRRWQNCAAQYRHAIAAAAIALLASFGPNVSVVLAADDDTSLHLLAGRASADDLQAPAYQFLYEMPRLIGPFALNLTDLNEGALPRGRRDEFGLEVGYWSPPLTVCRLGAAAGPDLFFNTTTPNWALRATDYSDKHGLGWILTGVAQCRIGGGLAIELRENRVGGVASFTSSVMLLGLVYTPGAPKSQADYPVGGIVGARDRIAVLGGWRTTDNYDFFGDRATAWSIAYSHAFNAHLGFAGVLLDEGQSQSIGRTGVAAQLAARQNFASDRLELFVAAGPYLARQIAYGLTDTDSTRLDGLIDFGVRWQWLNRIALTGKLSRALSSSEKDDADLYLFGVEYTLQ
jgi:hypothetical protein